MTTVVNHVDNVAALLAWTGSLADGDCFDLLGYDAVDDGGGQRVVYDSTSNADVDGGFVFPKSGVGVTLAFDGNLNYTGTSVQGRFLAIDQVEGNALRFGAKADHPTTDNRSPLQRMLNACQSLGESEGRRVRAVIPSGNYRIKSALHSKQFVDLHAAGAQLSYQEDGTNDPATTILTIGEAPAQGGPSKRIQNANMHLPSIVKVGALGSLTETQETSLIGVRLHAISDSTVRFSTIAHVAIGIQLHPVDSEFIAYNQFYGGAINGVKVGIDLKANTPASSGGWINENSFYSPNFSFTGNSASLGALYGVRFSKVSGGYPNCNNNRFYSPCFQVTDLDTSYELTSGLALELGHRYVNRQNQYEYECTAVGPGTVGTVPDHTTGEETEANGAKFRAVGLFFRSPVFHEDAGRSNRFIQCRWESGDGPFAIVQGDAAENEYEVAFLTGVNRNLPAVDVLSGRASVLNADAANKIRFTAESDPPKVVVGDLHKRLICSATHASMAGMHFHNHLSSALGEMALSATDFSLGRDYVYNGSARYHGFLVDVEDVYGIQIGRLNRGSGNAERINFKLYDANFQRVSVATDATTIMATSVGSMNTGQSFFRTDTDSQNEAVVFKGNGNPFRYVLVYSRLEDTDFTIKPILAGLQATGGNLGKGVKVRSAFEDTLNFGLRKCHGIPIKGFFEVAGEQIQNLNTTTGQPVGWYVKDSGILSDAWQTGVTVKKHELRVNANRVYSAESAGTTGMTAPTGTTTSNDGSIDWRYFADEATLVASSENYA